MVKFAPLIAGSVPVKFAAGKLVKFAPEPVGLPVKFPTNVVAVTTPVTSIPVEFAVTAEPTTILFVVAFKVLAVTIPVTVIPLGKLGAPFAPAFVIVPAPVSYTHLTLPTKA